MTCVGDVNSGALYDGAHHFPLRVYYEDTDAGGVVYHARYLHFAERARTELMRLSGTAYQQAVLNEGLAFVVRHCEISYNMPARLDDRLVVVTKLQDKRNTSLTLQQNIYKSESDQQILLAELTIVLVCVNMKQVRATRIPTALLEEMKQLDEKANQAEMLEQR